jgi:hypothetical protein
MHAMFKVAFAVAANHYEHEDDEHHGRLWAALDYASERCNVDASTLTEVLMDAAGIAPDGATGSDECWATLWAWEECDGEGGVLATLRALGDPTLLEMLATWHRTVDAVAERPTNPLLAAALTAQATALDHYVREACRD